MTKGTSDGLQGQALPWSGDRSSPWRSCTPLGGSQDGRPARLAAQGGRCGGSEDQVSTRKSRKLTLAARRNEGSLRELARLERDGFSPSANRQRSVITTVGPGNNPNREFKQAHIVIPHRDVHLITKHHRGELIASTWALGRQV